VAHLESSGADGARVLGALTHAQIPKGIIVTLCGYTSDARQLADATALRL